MTNRSVKFKEISERLHRGDGRSIPTADLRLYREHFDAVARLLNVSGPQFQPSFEYALKEHYRADDIIKSREAWV